MSLVVGRGQDLGAITIIARESRIPDANSRRMPVLAA